MPEGISEGGILLGEVLQASWLTQAFLGIAVKGSGAMYGVAVDLCPRRHSPPSAAGPFYILQARARVDVSWSHTRFPRKPWLYFEQP